MKDQPQLGAQTIETIVSNCRPDGKVAHMLNAAVEGTDRSLSWKGSPPDNTRIKLIKRRRSKRAKDASPNNVVRQELVRGEYSWSQNDRHLCRVLLPFAMPTDEAQFSLHQWAFQREGVACGNAFRIENGCSVRPNRLCKLLTSSVCSHRPCRKHPGSPPLTR